jgi:hypothetical protein
MAQSLSTRLYTQCSASLRLTGNNFAVIESAPLDTAQLPAPAGTLWLDLYIGTAQPNPGWIGQVQLYASCPSCRLDNEWIDQVELTPLSRGRWVKVGFKLTGEILGLLRQHHADFTWRLALNANPGSGPYLLDDLRYE